MTDPKKPTKAQRKARNAFQHNAPLSPGRPLPPLRARTVQRMEQRKINTQTARAAKRGAK